MGYGELSFRIAEGLNMGKPVLMPDIHHVQTLFPFKKDENILYYDPFSKKELMQVFEKNEPELRAIGKKGQQTWREWSSNYDKILEASIIQFIE